MIKRFPIDKIIMIETYYAKSMIDEDGKNYNLIKCEDNMVYANHKWEPFSAHYTDEFYINAGQKVKEYCSIGKSGLI